MENDSFGEGTGPKRPSRDPGTPEFTPSGPAPARTVRVVAGDFLLTVNPVDGSEIEPCPPGGPGTPDHPAGPVRRTAEERAEHERAAHPPAPAGPAAPRPPLLERAEERERVTGLLERGRSLRITGPAGSGRTALLDAVAEDCAELAPDGVVRLNGRHRTPADLLYDLFAAVHTAPRHRPDRAGLLRQVAGIGAVVALDDLEFGGAALTELLDAAPECAFVMTATPETPEPAADSPLEEVVLTGLGRAVSVELLQRTVDRPLAEDETNWAGDLWFESEGLPLRFVQAGALLRQCDELRELLREDPEAFEAFAPPEGVEGTEVALPTLGQGAAPAPLLASRLGESARRTLRFAVALGGEVPHQAHLPALIGDTHADAAIGELLDCGLLSRVGARYRLAAGVLAQLKEKGYADEAPALAHTAAQHYTWWTGHPSVTPERAVAEADAIVAALTALVASPEAGHPSAAVLLARSAAPAFAAGLHWGAWERALRTGSEAARRAGEVAQEAYFHHELGIVALCTDRLDRARAELETSIGMRGALADRSGTVAGRRALTLVDDRENGRVPTAEPVVTRPEDSRRAPLALPPGAGAAAPNSPDGPGTRPLPLVSGTLSVPPTLVSYQPPPGRSALARRGRAARALLGTRRNLIATGAGALLAVVLGTVLAIGPASDAEDPPGDRVGSGRSASADDDGLGPTDDPTDSTAGPAGPATGVPGTVPGRSSSSAAPSGSAGSSAPGPSTTPSGTASTGSAEPGESAPVSPPPSSTDPGTPSETTAPSSRPPSPPRPSTVPSTPSTAPTPSATATRPTPSASTPAKPGGGGPEITGSAPVGPDASPSAPPPVT
ncbi:ATP-binding protein [Streptomyces sp. NPDC001985]|uniref:ATP-binding protein n=1 Tax=Streptomyces sp. NPDC001985 TaxID=3154406 RepID=UPI003318EDCF